jgi:hypothetical protein
MDATMRTGSYIPALSSDQDEWSDDYPPMALIGP